MKLPQLHKLTRERFTTTIFLYVSLSLLIIFGALSSIFMHMQRDSLEAQVINDGIVLSQILSQTARLGIFTENPEQLHVPINALFNHAGICKITIFTTNGTILTQKMRETTKKPEAYATGATSNAWPKLCQEMEKTTSPIRFSFKSSEEFLMPVWNRPLTETGDSLFFDDQHGSQAKRTLIGAVSVSLSRQPLEDAITALLSRIVGIAILFLLLAATATYLIVRAASKPLNQLVHKVRALGVSEVPDELGLLTETFSQMVTGLEDAFTTINELNTSLEKKVETRTEELQVHGRYLEETNRQLEITLTELKNTQSQLVHAEKMAALGQLVAGVAHEINNTTNFITGALPPLTKTISQLKILLSAGSKDKPEIENGTASQSAEDLIKTLDTLLANISEGARRTSKIVFDLKKFSRPGDEVFVKSDIVAALESTLTLLYNEYKYDIEIIRDYEPDLPMISCFPNELNQVFLNILLNAIQAVRSRTNNAIKGQIQIIIRRINALLSIKFMDNGCGIPAPIIGKIFDPFFTTKEIGKGTGLGLSISYGIMKKHHGMINVSSKAGLGTEFELILPFTMQPIPAEPSPKIVTTSSSEIPAARSTIE